MSSALRVVAILECLAAHNQSLTRSEIARWTGLPPTTTRAILADMRTLGYVDVFDGPRYAPGPAASALATSFDRRERLRASLRPVLERLAATSGETHDPVGVGTDSRRRHRRPHPGLGGRNPIGPSRAGVRRASVHHRARRVPWRARAGIRRPTRRSHDIARGAGVRRLWADRRSRDGRRTEYADARRRGARGPGPAGITPRDPRHHLVTEARSVKRNHPRSATATGSGVSPVRPATAAPSAAPSETAPAAGP